VIRREGFIIFEVSRVIGDIHPFEVGGRRFLLSVTTGALVEVDEEAWDLVQRLKDGEDVAGHPCLAELAELVAEGVFSQGEEELWIRTAREARGRSVVKALCLNVAHSCNMRCRYCFAAEGTYRGERAVMSREVGRRAVDFLIEASGARRNLEIDFFGGEPLLNMAVVREVVDYARARGEETGKRFRFTLTTNGLLLDEETTRYLAENMDNVVLSLDGRPEVNDRMRPLPDGSGSYDRVVDRLLSLIRRRGDRSYYVRGTFTRHNLDFAADVLHLSSLGFKNISVEPAIGSGRDWSLREEDLPRVLREYEELAVEMASRGGDFEFFHFQIDLERGPCLGKRLKGCGAGTEYLAVTPAGELYPCHQFVGEAEFLLGDVFDGIHRMDLVRKFSDADLYQKRGCPDCPVRFYCGGGCYANAYARHGDITHPDELGCALHRRRVECALYLQAALRERG